MGIVGMFSNKEDAERAMTALEEAGIDSDKIVFYSRNVVTEADAEGTPSGANAVTQDPDTSGMVAADPGLEKILNEHGAPKKKVKLYSESYLHGDKLVLVKTNLFNRGKVKAVLRNNGGRV